MQVRKRTGELQDLDISNIRKQTIPACEGLTNVSYERLEVDAQIFFQDGMPTADIQQALINTALNNIDIDQPDWTYVAQRLKLYDLYHRIKHYYNKKQPGNVYELVTLQDYISTNKHLFSEWFTKYTEEDIEYLNRQIDSKRDLLYDYTGFALMEDMYLLKDLGKVVELPQHMHMAIAMFIMQNEPKEKCLEYVIETYHMLSRLEYINATPINANGRIKDGGLISCILVTMEDSAESILDKVKEVGMASKFGAGLGIDMARLRSYGSSIKNNANAAKGKIPFAKIFNDVALALDQNGRRSGSFAVYTECWDLEIFEFMELRKSSGEERRRARDLFLGIMYNDLFMEREEQDGEWILFDPKDVPALTETFGDTFKTHYLAYEEEYRNNPSTFNPNTKVIKVRDVLREHIKLWTESGMPFIAFKDTINNAHKYRDIGVIRSSNLCTEVVVYTDSNHSGVCNLGSINLSRYTTKERLKEVIYLANRVMDNCIDLTAYPSIPTRNFQDRFRSVGLGCLGEAEYLANNKIHYGSIEHKEFLDDLWKFISETLYESSKELAKEKGECIANPGYRNGYFMAIAPNSSSAILAGTTNGLEPVYNKIWIEENKRGTFKLTAPHINIDNIEYYKNPYEIPMEQQLEVNAIRQKYIDMAQSQNVFLDPNRLTVKRVRDVINYAWKQGVKTLYYLRSKPPKLNIAKDTKISCVGCVN